MVSFLNSFEIQSYSSYIISLINFFYSGGGSYGNSYGGKYGGGKKGKIYCQRFSE